MKILLTILITMVFTLSCSTTNNKNDQSLSENVVDNTLEYTTLVHSKKAIINLDEKIDICLNGTKDNTIIKENGHYYIITRALSNDDNLDLEMGLYLLSSSSRTNLSYFNGTLLSHFSDFVLKNNKDIKNIEKLKEISSINGSSAKSKFSSKNPKSLGFFKESKNKRMFTCNLYDLEEDIYNKLKKTNKDLSKEDINKILSKVLSENQYKIKELK